MIVGGNIFLKICNIFLCFAVFLLASFTVYSFYFEAESFEAASDLNFFAQNDAINILGKQNNVADLSLSDLAPIPDKNKINKEIDNIFGVGISGVFSGIVQDAHSGEVIYNKAANNPAVVASNIKILTAAAVLNTWQPEETLATKVVSGANPNEITLVAAGDVLLSPTTGDANSVAGRAGLADLVTQTVANLREKNITNVTLFLDDSLFVGPAIRDVWDAEDIANEQISAIYPLAFSSGNSARNMDAALNVAEAFSAQLAAENIAVAPKVTRSVVAEQNFTEIAKVDSANISDLVRYMMVESDNYLAEVLGRLVAYKVSQKVGVTALDSLGAVKTEISKLGISVENMVLADTNGLSVESSVPPQTLLDLVALALVEANINPLINSFSVAGLNGTLLNRFVDMNVLAKNPLGVVRGKTGTLYESSALTGFSVTKEGRLLLFSFVANNLKINDLLKVRNNLDSTVAVLVNCGCT